MLISLENYKRFKFLTTLYESNSSEAEKMLNACTVTSTKMYCTFMNCKSDDIDF